MCGAPPSGEECRRVSGGYNQKQATLTLPVFHFSAFCDPSSFSSLNRLGGLVVKASASRAEDPGFEFLLRRDFSGVESYQ